MNKQNILDVLWLIIAHVDSYNSAVEFIEKCDDNEYPDKIKSIDDKITFIYYDDDIITYRTFDSEGFTDNVSFMYDEKEGEAP
jgi:hypothetical protein